MKEMLFRPGTRTVTKERASAVAWATNRRGRNPWKGPVVEEIQAYLKRHGYNPPLDNNRNWMRETLKAIESNGFGYLKVEDDGSGKRGRVIEFNFHDDVDLNGHSLPEKATIEANQSRAQMERYHGPAITLQEAEELARTGPVVKSTGVMPPLPGLAVPPPYGLDHLVQLLTDWSHKAPEDYAKWIEAATEVLEGVV